MGNAYCKICGKKIKLLLHYRQKGNAYHYACLKKGENRDV